MQQIRKVAVIGAGVMGAGIAAQIANAGTPVLLLDIVKPGLADRNAVAAGAVAKMLKTEPAPFMSKDAVKLVEVGNIEDDLGKLAECDWVVEAIIERLDLKQDLYRKIDAVRRPGTAVSSNTSTIPLADLVRGMSDGFQQDFLITHFFNPPRYMRLLEVVAGPASNPQTVAAVSRFSDIALGKTIVNCNDAPGFIANRLGVYWLQVGILEAIDAGLTVEEADAVMGRPFGIPKTGVFGLIDLVGLDLMPHVNASLLGSLPNTDPFHVAQRDLPMLTRMIAEGYTGRKGKGGFYRLNRDGGGRKKEAMDLATGQYRAEQKAELPELAEAGRNLRALLSGTTPAGRYAWRVIGQTLSYAAHIIPQAAGDIEAIDAAMKLGYNWQSGPFELADKIGVDWLIAKLEADGMPVPAMLRIAAGRSFYRVENGKLQALGTDGNYADVVRAPGVLLLEDVKRASKPVLRNGSASVWDIGDGVLCFEFTSKSNSLDEALMSLYGKTIALVQQKYKALVIYNEGRNFSVGANLGLALFAVNIAAWGEIEKLVKAGQDAYRALKYAPFPVVSAPSGMALGGGCEILLHSDAIQMHAETYTGLVECGVGVIPGWGGCTEMLARWQPMLPKGPMPAAAKVFEMVSTAQVSKSAADARAMGILRKNDGITMNRDRLLADAKAKALSLVEGYTPPQPAMITLPGAAGKLAFDAAVQGFRKLGKATEHDVTVAGALATVLSGGDAEPWIPLNEEDVLALERQQFLALLHNSKTLARIEHTLETGKPLRN
ncbi:MAG: 3-hydroxyacyl-CoA dehydrogenase NAD-binding domain-containing protein [Acetobacteraceae bacterium]|nr:3-hydroxyacyl-CoA dehydrogenase NAD-binding domain-containing protein [Acetobacteraceae bacterium]